VNRGQELGSQEWPVFNENFVRERYNRIAPYYPLFEILFALPWGIRARAVRRLELKPGDRVLEVGCGTGRNLPFLVNAVGTSGRIYAADLSPEMLKRARSRCEKNGWKNVELVLEDASHYSPPEKMDAVIFSLSYCVLPRRLDVLRRAWDSLRPGGKIVLMDAKPVTGWLRQILTPLAAWLSRKTVIGNPYLEPWNELREIAGQVHMEEVWGGAYFICWAAKG
jgi:demethylmenaquinone methyltransferase/2-methoxy-6-polyprenyl-1,4-benzoquinol methylase